MHLRVAFPTSLAWLALLTTLAATLTPQRASAEAPAACTGTLSGAFTATFKCSAKVRDLEDGTSVFELQQTEKVDGLTAFGPGAWIIPGAPEKRAYPFDALGLGKSSVVLDKEGTLYIASRTMQARGEASLQLTSVTAQKALPLTWIVHGTFRARLVPSANTRTDEIVVQVKF
jgi:hypothetical protein